MRKDHLKKQIKKKDVGVKKTGVHVFCVRYTNCPNYKIILERKKTYCKCEDSGFVSSSSLGESCDYCFGNLGLKLRYRSGLVPGKGI